MEKFTKSGSEYVLNFMCYLCIFFIALFIFLGIFMASENYMLPLCLMISFSFLMVFVQFNVIKLIVEYLRTIANCQIEQMPKRAKK